MSPLKQNTANSASPCSLSPLQRGLTALSLAVQGAHTDTASLLQAHVKARAL